MEAAQKWWHDGILLCPRLSQTDKLDHALFTIAPAIPRPAELQNFLIQEKSPLGVLKLLLVDAQFLTGSKEKIERAEAVAQMIQKAMRRPPRRSSEHLKSISHSPASQREATVSEDHKHSGRKWI